LGYWLGSKENRIQNKIFYTISLDFALPQPSLQAPINGKSEGIFDWRSHSWNSMKTHFSLAQAFMLWIGCIFFRLAPLYAIVLFSSPGVYACGLDETTSFSFPFSPFRGA
jgi:hypothetical protein